MGVLRPTLGFFVETLSFELVKVCFPLQQLYRAVLSFYGDK